MPINFVMQGKCLLSDISRPANVPGGFKSSSVFCFELSTFANILNFSKKYLYFHHVRFPINTVYAHWRMFSNNCFLNAENSKNMIYV